MHKRIRCRVGGIFALLALFHPRNCMQTLRTAHSYTHGYTWDCQPVSSESEDGFYDFTGGDGDDAYKPMKRKQQGQEQEDAFRRGQVLFALFQEHRLMQYLI